jgi:hypothetical protein
MNSQSLEVGRCWLAAEWGMPQATFDAEAITKHGLDVQRRVANVSDGEIEQHIRSMDDPDKRERILNWQWERREIWLQEFGPWRTVGEALPLEACKDSAVEAAEFVRNHPDELPRNLRVWNGMDHNSEYVVSAAKIRSIASMSDFIWSCEHLAILVGETRQRGREDCNSKRFSSEEGSHRAIGLALAGRATIWAWVCNPR